MSKFYKKLNSREKLVVYSPLVITEIFLAGTILMFSFSPWKWPVDNMTQVILYAAGCDIALACGYYLCVQRWFSYSRAQKRVDSRQRFPGRFINLVLLLSLVFLYPKILIKLGVEWASPIDFVDMVINGFTNPAVAYSNKFVDVYEGYRSMSNPMVVGYFFVTPLLFMTVPIGIFYWQCLKPIQKFIICLLILTDVMTYVAMGTNKGIFDYIIWAPLIIAARDPAKMIRGILDFGIKKLLVVLVSILFVVMSVAYFSKGIQERKTKNFYYEASTGITVDSNAPVLRLLPDYVANAYLSLDNYLTQGYYALGKSLDMEFRFCYGVGNSYFLTNYVGRKLGILDMLYNRSYPYRLESEIGYSAVTKWHTFYVWWANDISFWGVPILVLLVGYYFGGAWLEIIYLRSPSAIAIFPLFMIMIFYMSANNQIFGYEDSLMTFTLLFLYRSLVRKSRKR